MYNKSLTLVLDVLPEIIDLKLYLPIQLAKFKGEREFMS